MKLKTKNDAATSEARPEEPAEASGESLLDFAGASARPAGDGAKATTKTNALDELGDIFSTDGGGNNIAEPLKPVSLMPNGKF